MLIPVVVAFAAFVSVGPMNALALVTPTVASTPMPGNITLGQTETDKATVTGNGITTPTGTVSFAFCGPAVVNCTSGGVVYDRQMLDGTGAATSTDFGPNQGGTWCVRADYSGDNVYGAATDGGTSCFTVNKAGSSTTGQVTATPITLGSPDTVTATVTGVFRGLPPDGTVTFSRCGPTPNATCGANPTWTQIGSPVNLTPFSGPYSYTATATSPSFTPNSVGTWCFLATYNGDSNSYTGSADSGTSCVTVNQAMSTTTSQPSTTSITVNNPVTDTATVTGNPAAAGPTGTVSFYVCGSPATSCSSTTTPVQGNPVSLTGGGNAPTATSGTFTPTVAGTYCFYAVYSGDTNYATSNDGGAGECFTVGGAGTANTVSHPSATNITTSQTLTDTATVTGGIANTPPTGSVSFYVCGPSASSCASTATAVTGNPKSLTGSGQSPTATSGSFSPSGPGTWCFYAVYSGDNNYGTSNDGSAGECFKVTGTGSASTTSKPSVTNIALGGSATDTATVTAATPPTGTVSFYACGSATPITSCASTATPVTGNPKALTGSGNAPTATSGTFTPNAAGTWCFLAVYSGDNTYASSSDGSSAECFKVTGTGSAPTTSKPSATSIALGGSATDTATVTGATPPTGTVSFYACGSATPITSCASTATPVTGNPKALTGAGNAPTAASGTFTPNAAGTWCFLAVYSGDNTYASSSDGSSAECFKVTGSTHATTSSHPGSASISTGQSDTDVVTVTGSTSAALSGTVTFYICGPSVSSCSSTTTQVGATKTLSGSGNSGSTTSDPFGPVASKGTYCFFAVYSGDNTYASSSDGSSSECFLVTGTAASSTTSKARASSITPGGLASDVATVTGGSGTPTGTVTFYACGPPNGSPCLSASNQVGQPINLSSGTATSATFAPVGNGTWCFRSVYSGDGTYAASNDGGTACFTLAAPGAINNGSFQDDNYTGWVVSGAPGSVATIGTGGDAPDSFVAGVGKRGGNSTTSKISQTFTAPSGATTLFFWWWGFCVDSAGGDLATATLKDNGTKVVTTIFSVCQASTNWQTASVAVTAGHKYTLSLINKDDSDNDSGPVGSGTAFDEVGFTQPTVAPAKPTFPSWGSPPSGNVPSVRSY